MEKPNIDDFRFPNGDMRDLIGYSDKLEEYIEFIESQKLPDHYAGKKNARRIKAWRFESEKYNIDEETVGKIFNAGADWYKSDTIKNI